MTQASTRRLLAFITALAAAAGPAAAEPEGGDSGEDGSDLTAAVDRCAERATTAEDELRRRALAHYNRGAVYYEQGDYESSVDEFLASYCDAPHPQTLFNLGQSYERLLDFETAVAFFDRFLREADPEARNVRRARVRVRVLRRLPARVRVATVPAAARVSILRGNTLAASGDANSKDALLVRGGDYTLKVELAGHQTIEQEVDLAIGQPYSYYFELKRKKGSLRVQTSPRSARIYVDDKLVGLGSYVETIPIGRYRVRVEADKREPVRREVVVVEGQRTDEVFTLPAPPRSGRWELIIAGGLMGLFAAPAALSAADLSDTTRGVLGFGGTVLGVGASLVAVPKDIPIGHSSFTISSALVGGIEGASIAALFACDVVDNADGQPENDCNSDLIAGIATGGLISGLAFGAFTADRFDFDSGDAAIINSGALWGTAVGLLFFESFDENPELLAPLILGGLNLGLISSVALAARVKVSRRRIALIDLAGIGGAIAGFALATGLEARDERTAHVALVGIGTGLIVGTYLTRFVDELDSDIGTVQPTTGAAIDIAGRRTTTFGASLQF